MARNIAYWYGKLVDEKVNKIELQNLVGTDNSVEGLKTDILNSPSAVMEWRLQTWITAVCMWLLDVLFDLFKADVNAIVAGSSYGHQEWWIATMKKFQYGDNLEIIVTPSANGDIPIPTYAVKDESKQIIKFVAVTKSTDGTALIKVAKDDGSGLPTPLSNDELNAVRSFVDRLQSFGLKISAISLATDLVKYEYEFYYNPLVDLETVIKPSVETAVTSYHQTLEFDGTIVLERLEDELQKASGYSNHKLISASARANAGQFEAFDRTYKTSSGYVKIDDAYPVLSTFNFIPAN